MRRMLLFFVLSILVLPVTAVSAQCDWEGEIQAVQRRGYKSVALVACPGSTLPSSITTIDDLNTLRIAGSDYETIPSVVFRLTDLKFLQFNRGILSDVPQDIISLESLESLSLQDNALTEFPMVLTSLTTLKRLDLSGNNITELPPEIAKLTQLESLTIENNLLTELPPEIGALTRLDTLDLEGNQLQTLPPEIGDLSALEFLILRDNDLSTLPREIGQLPNSVLLFVEGNPNLQLPENDRPGTALRYYSDPEGYRAAETARQLQPVFVLIAQVAAVGLAGLLYWKFLHGHPKRIAAVAAVILIGVVGFFIWLSFALRSLGSLFDEAFDCYFSINTSILFFVLAIVVPRRRRHR